MIIQNAIDHLCLILILILESVQFDSISLAIRVKIFVQKKFFHFLIDPQKISWQYLFENSFVFFPWQMIFWKWNYLSDTGSESLVNDLRMISHHLNEIVNYFGTLLQKVSTNCLQFAHYCKQTLKNVDSITHALKNWLFGTYWHHSQFLKHFDSKTILL
jgi:hypothetical protein